MDIKIEKKKYLVPRKYWAWIGGGAVLIAVLIWLGLGNFSSTLKVDRKGLSIGTVEKAQFNDYVSVDGQVVPISVVQISSEEGGIVLEKVVDEGAHVNKGDVIHKFYLFCSTTAFSKNSVNLSASATASNPAFLKSSSRPRLWGMDF